MANQAFVRSRGSMCCFVCSNGRIVRAPGQPRTWSFLGSEIARCFPHPMAWLELASHRGAPMPRDLLAAEVIAVRAAMGGHTGRKATVIPPVIRDLDYNLRP